MAEITFSVLEASDAESFTVTNTSSTITPSHDITLTLTDSEDDDYTFTIAVGDDLDDFNGDGLEVTLDDVGYTGSVFADGIYTILLTCDDFDDTTNTEGFAAVITDSVMTESLAYRVYLTAAQKEFMNEKIRLLNNLAYAAEVGAIDAFEENLEVLERME